MPLPDAEHSFEFTKLNLPDNHTEVAFGRLNSSASSLQNPFSKSAVTSAQLPYKDRKSLQSDFVGKTANVPDEHEASSKPAGASQDYLYQEESERPHQDKKDFIWTEDLSENGQKLFLLLLGDIGHMNDPPALAKEEGINLDEGLKELRHHDVLDERDPKIILLNINLTMSH